MWPRRKPIKRGRGIAFRRVTSEVQAPDEPLGTPSRRTEEKCAVLSPWEDRRSLRILLVNNDQGPLQDLKASRDREGFEVVGEASDGPGAVRLAQRLRPDVAVLDLAMLPMTGIGAAREILRESPGTRTMLVTVLTGLPCVLEAIRAGVRGYIAKSEVAENLLPAILSVAAGRIYLSPAIADTIIEAYLRRGDPASDALTSRQVEVLQLLAEGMSTKEIGACLGISVKTVEFHCHRIKARLAIRTMEGLVHRAIGLKHIVALG